MGKVSINNGKDNIVLNDIKDSPITINKYNSGNPAESVLKTLYDALNEERDVRNFYFVTIISRGGISLYTNKEVVQFFFASMNKLEALAKENRFYIPDEFFLEIIEHCKVTKKLNSSFELLVMTIYSADQDAITPACDITYDREIDCTPKFVKEAMEEFNSLDPNFAYLDYAEYFAQHDVSINNLIKLIKG